MRRFSLHVFACIALGCVTLFCSSMSPTRADENISQQNESPSAFTSVRHPHTVDSLGPYPVTLRQLAGEKITSGYVVYAVWDANGKKQSEGRSNLKSTANSQDWVANIPGQSTGSEVSYHFALTSPTGKTLHHPAHAQANYRFRMLGLKVLSVAISKPHNKEPSVKLLVQAVSRPTGDLIIRHMSHTFPAPRDIRVTLSTEETQVGDSKFKTYAMQAKLPKLKPGELADFYFSLQTAQGIKLSVPADAPTRVYSFKQSIRDVQLLNNDSFVLDISAMGHNRWIGMKGGGVSVWKDGSSTGHWDMKDGMPSGVARFVVPDPVSKQVYVGTDRGVVSIDTEGKSLMDVVTPVPSAWQSAFNPMGSLQGQYRAGPGAISPLDGTLVFQIQSEQEFEQEHPAVIFMQLKDDKLSEWRMPVEAHLVGLTSSSFDEVEGCWLIGGSIHDKQRNSKPVVVKNCGDKVETIAIEDFALGDNLLLPQRVIAVAQDPETGALVVALEFSVSHTPKRVKGFGIYQIDSNTDELSPLAHGSPTIDAELTSLSADWQRRRLLIGTFGQGILTVEGDAIKPLLNTDNLPSEITSLKVDQAKGAILVGTSRGAYELTGDKVISLSLDSHGEGVVLTDAIPMDVASQTGHVLLSSYSEGLIQLDREQNGTWQPVESLRPGHEVPKGLFGEAQYTATGGKAAIIHSQGILRVEDKKTTILNQTNGLHSPHILRLLTLRSGEMWLAHTPMPFGKGAGAALQFLRDDRVLKTIDISNRNLATISRWVEVPERDSVFAATRVGVVEIHKDGALTRLSKNSATSIHRNPHTGVISAVGNTVERWNGERFDPVLFRVDHPRWPKGKFYAGSPIDVAVDKTGVWYLLFNKGVLVVLDSQANFLNLMDWEDGIPSTARRLLLHPKYGDLFVGSSREGLVIVPTVTE